MRKKYGFAELGPADGPVKRAIFGENSAKMYRYDDQEGAWRDDRFAAIKSDYERRRPRSLEPALRLRRCPADGGRRFGVKIAFGPRNEGRGTEQGGPMRKFDHPSPSQPAEGRRRRVSCWPSRRGALRAQPKIAPPNIIKAGTLVMSINPTLPPLQFVDDKGQLQGMRVELANECCKRLGLAPEYIRTEFATMIPGLAAKRWDMINTGIFWTEERSKLMYMVPYEQAAISFLAAKGNPLGLKTVDDLAGKRISVELGGIEERRTREVNDIVTKKGLKPVTRA